MAEWFFRDPTQNRLRRGVFPQVADLIEAIQTYVDRRNQAPKRFFWTARATDTLAKIHCASRALDMG